MITLHAQPADAGALVVIDGATGAGKTQLAAQVRARLQQQGVSVTVLSTDLLVPGWTGLSEGVSRTATLLSTLAVGQEGRVPTWDWQQMVAGDELCLPPLAGRTLVIEGCGALAAAAQDLRSLRVVRVLVEAPQALRRARIAARDGYTWDIDAWQLQEERQRSRWQQEAAWWPQVLVRHAAAPSGEPATCGGSVPPRRA